MQSRKIPEPNASALPRKGIFLLITLSLFWGLAWPAIKISVSEIPPWTFRSYCLVLSGILRDCIFNLVFVTIKIFKVATNMQDFSRIGFHVNWPANIY